MCVHVSERVGVLFSYGNSSMKIIPFGAQCAVVLLLPLQLFEPSFFILVSQWYWKLQRRKENWNIVYAHWHTHARMTVILEFWSPSPYRYMPSLVSHSVINRSFGQHNGRSQVRFLKALKLCKMVSHNNFIIGNHASPTDYCNWSKWEESYELNVPRLSEPNCLFLFHGLSNPEMTLHICYVFVRYFHSIQLLRCGEINPDYCLTRQISRWYTNTCFHLYACSFLILLFTTKAIA